MQTMLEFLMIILVPLVALVLFSIGATIIPFVYNLLVPGETIKETALYWTYEVYKERWELRKKYCKNAATKINPKQGDCHE